MAKKLLNVTFADPNGAMIYNLACNSSDNVAYISGGQWVDSKERSLNQVGCNFIQPASAAADAQHTPQYALRSALSKANYSPARMPFPPKAWPSTYGFNTNLYLNGKAVDDDGTPMPYIRLEYDSYKCPGLYYYRADGTFLGNLYSAHIGTAGGNYVGWYGGQLYDDGTFVGSCGPIRAKVLFPGVWSVKRYEWSCTNTYDTPVRIISEAIINDIQEYLPVEPETGSAVEEGTGDFDATSDPVDFPGLPGVSALDSGMCAMYKMTAAQLKELSTYLWSGLFDLDTFKKMFSDPMEAIYNLCIMPVSEGASTASVIRIGNMNASAMGYRVSNQYHVFNFGTINLNEYWANFADYSPYTKLSIFLPYVGVQSISIDDVMNGSIQLKGYVDLLSGSIQYMLKSVQTNRAGHSHSSILYTWGGNCQYQIPLSASNMTQVVNAILSTTGVIAGGAATIATAGAAAPATAAAAGALKASTAVSAVGTATGTIGGVMGAKTHVQRGGGIGGAVGIFGVQTPYLILERPEQIFPANFESVKGNPSMRTGALKDYTGFVKVEAVNLSIPKATENELRDIENLLKEGVIV